VPTAALAIKIAAAQIGHFFEKFRQKNAYFAPQVISLRLESPIKKARSRGLFFVPKSRYATIG
jgi:hypothetical protein